jgi:hypothetical protein
MGLLYGAGGSGPMYVPVPVRLGLDSAASPDDLDVTWWIPLDRTPNTAMMDLDSTRITITHWPFESDEPLKDCFTICVAMQLGLSDPVDNNVPPLNHFFDAESQGSFTPFRGNVLVVKHSPTGHLANIGPADCDLASVILKRFVFE